MKVIGGILAAAAVAAVLVFAGGGGTASGQDGEQGVSPSGYWQGIDSMNPLRGVTVAAYEAWNMQYATLTDKAAKDFSADPGARRVLGGVGGRQDVDLQAAPGHQVVRRRAADGRGRRLHDQPLARRGVAQPHLGHRRTSRPRRSTRPRSRSRRRCRTRSCPTLDVYIVPKHICEKYDAKEITKYNGQDGVGSGPYHARPSSRRASSRASRRTRTTAAASRRSTRS